MPESLVWLVVAVLLLLGLFGAFLPVIPGAPLILAAGVWLEAFLPEYLSTGTLIALGVAALVSVLLDLALTAVGGKAFGGGRWGFLGATIGAIIGLVVGPFGLLGGAVLGAVLGEALIAKKPPAQAALAGIGAGIGLVAAVAAKTVLASVMIVLFLADCFLF